MIGKSTPAGFFLSRSCAAATLRFDCHRDPAPHLRPPEAIYKTDWHRTPDAPSPAALAEQYHVGGRTLTDCSICHR
jgi:hypothetical protein